ncbi:hypothetical protein K438DRAFT_1969635 [Mycena galopus ATCC 62051]|nr:hypothetical protein K438DRAFT_1969635 [Mycena galopus ATCC 62051]
MLPSSIGRSKSSKDEVVAAMSPPRKPPGGLRLKLVTQEMCDFQNVLELLADHRVFAIHFKPLFRTSSFTELYSNGVFPSIHWV